MSLISDIKKKAQTLVQNATAGVQATAGQIKKAEQQVASNIQKSVTTLKGNLQKVSGGMPLPKVAVYAAVYPYFFPMKAMLDKKGVKYQNNIADVTKKFYDNVVSKSSYNFGGSFYGGVDAPINYDAVPVFSFDDNSYNVDGENFDGMSYNESHAEKFNAWQQIDDTNAIGKTLGAAAGAAIGGGAGTAAAAGTAGAATAASPAGVAVGGAVGAAAGGATESVVKKVVAWFFNLVKAKKEGRLTDKNLIDAADAATNSLAGMSPEDAAAANAVSSSGFGGLSTTWLIVIAVVVVGGVILIMRKK